MKSTITYLGLSISIIFLTVLNSMATPPEDEPVPSNDLRIFGFGIRAATFTKLAIYGVESPTTIISIVITPHRSFRIEPEIGFFSDKQYNSTLQENLVDKSMHIGLGIYGMINHEATNIYLGFRAASITTTTEFVGYNTGVAPSWTITYFKDEQVGKQMLMGVVAGAEYLFSNHFGFGGEISLQQSSYHEDVNGSGTGHDHKDDKVTNLLTGSGLFVRFYF